MNESWPVLASPGQPEHWLLQVLRLVRAALACALLSPLAAQEPGGPPTVVRFGISARELGKVNQADMKAAMKVWVNSVTRERNLHVDPYPVVLHNVAEMVEALRLKQIDLLTACADEYMEVQKTCALSAPFCSVVNGKVTIQYVLVVRAESGIKQLRDLRNQPLTVLETPRTILAPDWLDSELWRNHLPASPRFFSRTTVTGKLNLAVLPVFFNQAGAALVDRAGFATACELNPQLSAKLRVLASSPELVPSMTCLRPDGDPVVVENYVKDAASLGETPSGKLLLSLFQIDSVAPVQAGELQATLGFLREYQRLKAEYEQHRGGP